MDVLSASCWGHDAKRRVVAVAIRRGRRVRRGYKNEQRSCENTLVLLFTALRYRRIQNTYYHLSLVVIALFRRAVALIKNNWASTQSKVLKA